MGFNRRFFEGFCELVFRMIKPRIDMIVHYITCNRRETFFGQLILMIACRALL